MTTIEGTCPSKSNCYRIGHKGLFKTEALKRYEDAFYLQCTYRNRNIKGRFEIELDVYYPSDRSDLDGALKVVMDCLQKCKAIENDRKCVKITARKFVDKQRPRVELKLTEVGTDQTDH